MADDFLDCDALIPYLAGVTALLVIGSMVAIPAIHAPTADRTQGAHAGQAAVPADAPTSGETKPYDGERGSQAPPLNQTEIRTVTAAAATADEPRTYIVSATSERTLRQDTLGQYGTVGTVVGARAEVQLLKGNVSQVESLSWVSAVRPASISSPTTTTAISETAIGDLHEQGVTGEGVNVAIIDGGFDTTNTEISNQIVAEKSFRTTTGSASHGTAVAEIVAQTAPDAQLTLLSTKTDLDVAAALEYTAQNDIDIVVLSLGFITLPDDGRSFVSQKATAATDAGVLVVPAAGNFARQHWEGTFRNADGDNYGEWVTGVERNCVGGCNYRYRGTLSVTLRWEDTGSSSDFSLYVYNADADRFATKTVRVSGYEHPTERKIVSVPEFTALDLLLVHEDGDTQVDELEVMVEGTNRIQHHVIESSLTPPADAHGATTVAAYERNSGVAPYSSAGPTDDGRQGVAITGLTNIDTQTSGAFAGTSASAPYVGGVAALVQDTSGTDLSPTELSTTLATGTQDLKQEGADSRTGAGLVDPAAAVTAATPTITVDRAGSADGTGSFNTASGEGYIFDGATVFQGESDIQLGGTVAGGVVKTATPNQGTALQLPSIPQDQATGHYTVEGTRDSAGVTVRTPRVTTLEVVNSSLKSVDGDTIQHGTEHTGAGNLTVIGAWNYSAAENLELTVENDAGVDVTPSVIETGDATRSQAEQGSEIGSTTPNRGGEVGRKEVEYPIDLSTVGTGRYTMTLAGSDDLDFGQASQTTTVTVTHNTDDSGTALNISRSLSSAEVIPGETTTMTMTATAQSDSVTLSDTFNRSVASTSLNSVTVNGTTASPVIQEANSDGVVVTLNRLQPGSTVAITYQVRFDSQTPVGSVYRLNGNVTSGNSSANSTYRVTIAEATGPVAQFDSDGDGIEIAELGQAAIAFARGELTIAELGQVAISFAQS